MGFQTPEVILSLHRRSPVFPSQTSARLTHPPKRVGSTTTYSSTSNAMSLTGRNAVVTGGSRGIGAQIALDLAREGASVLINYVSPSSEHAAKEVVKAIEDLNNGAKGYICKADVGSATIGEDIVAACSQAFGGPDFKVHILIHNAGVNRNNLLQHIKLEDYDFVMNVNVRGPILISQALLPHIPKHAGGRIIMLSSVSARQGPKFQTVYAASKIAVEQMVNVWSNEFGKRDGINCVAVNPGPVATDMWDANTDEIKAGIDTQLGVATPSEISDIIVFLAGDKARWCQGSVINANGGLVVN